MSQRFDKYIFVAPGSDYGRAMWADLERNPSCFFYEYPVETRSRLLREVYHLHFSFGINSRINLPYKKIWDKKYVFNQIDFQDKLNYCIILPDVSACRIDVKYLEYLRRKPNIELVLVNVNVINKKRRLIEERLKCFSKVFSFDINDCEKYGCIYHPTIYSTPNIAADNLTYTDAFFVGTYTPHRYRKLVSLYKKILSKNGTADFYIINVPNKEKRIKGIHYNKKLPYSEVQKKTQATNCVVEIMNPGQAGLTLRAMEAICLNKKLLTDNKTIKTLKYFSTGFIDCFSELKNNDVEFILRKVAVNYNYQDDFSPNTLLSHIEEEYCEVEK